MPENKEKGAYNSRFTFYPDETSFAHYSRPIWYGDVVKGDDEDITEAGQISERCKKSFKDECRTEEEKEHCMKVSMNSTKNRIYYLARSNRWEWFITLTFDQERYKSDDYDFCINRLKTFFNNLRMRKCPDIKYLIIPELHKDGTHFHFHGLVSDTSGCTFSDSGIKHDGRKVYNWTDWTYGFTTCTKVRSNARVVKYVTKYITKTNGIVALNKKRYYCSKNLARADIQKGMLPMLLDDFLAQNSGSLKHLSSVSVSPAHMHVTYAEFENPEEADADTEQENPDT